jgi:hypothetical protein
MKIQFLLMLSILFINCATEATNLGKNLYRNKKNEIELAHLIQRMDNIAARKGDKLSMANVANSCLRKGDYACAYENILISLTSSYWWMDLKLPTHVLELHDRARDGLSDEEAEKITKKVKIYFEEEAKKTDKEIQKIKIAFNDIANKNPSEWELLARKGKILAAGHLAKKYLSEKNYTSSYVWATIASIGASWQILGESMLSYRDQARKHMDFKQIMKADQKIQVILRVIKKSRYTSNQKI